MRLAMRLVHWHTFFRLEARFLQSPSVAASLILNLKPLVVQYALSLVVLLRVNLFFSDILPKRAKSRLMSSSRPLAWFSRQFRGFPWFAIIFRFHFLQIALFLLIFDVLCTIKQDPDSPPDPLLIKAIADFRASVSQRPPWSRVTYRVGRCCRNPLTHHYRPLHRSSGYSFFLPSFSNTFLCSSYPKYYCLFRKRRVGCGCTRFDALQCFGLCYRPRYCRRVGLTLCSSLRSSSLGSRWYFDSKWFLSSHHLKWILELWMTFFTSQNNALQVSLGNNNLISFSSIVWRIIRGHSFSSHRYLKGVMRSEWWSFWPFYAFLLHSFGGTLDPSWSYLESRKLSQVTHKIILAHWFQVRAFLSHLPPSNSSESFWLLTNRIYFQNYDVYPNFSLNLCFNLAWYWL